MKAAVLHGREDVRIETVPVPPLGPGEVLVRARVALTCGTDAKVFRRGYHARMIVPPSVFGHEMAGVVEEVGAGVEGFAPGTPVVPANSAPCAACFFCGAGQPNLCDDLLFWNGAYAELAVIPARIVATNLLRLEDGMSFRRAAMVEPLACVLRGVDETGLAAGQSVAVIGTGAIALLFVALARLRGAHVTVAGRRQERLQQARAMGAAQVVLSGSGDLAARLRERSDSARGFDVVVEAVGLPETSEAALRAVRKGGTVQLFAGCPAGAHLAVDAQALHYQELTVKSTFHHTPASIRAAFRLIADGHVDPDAFISGEEPLEALPDVLRRMGDGAAGLKTAILPGN
jgi:L-iditol 2-dehydrogenase